MSNGAWSVIQGGKTMSQPKLLRREDGCTYTTGSGRGERTRYCFKLKQEGEEYCPHHALICKELANEQKRRMEKVRMGKERKALHRKLLESSPLKADNPSFDEGPNGAYSR